MNIAIIGYGKMGKTIERIAKERNHNIIEIIGSSESEKINASLAEKCDVAIEFTKPSSCRENILKCLNNNISVISGTTGRSYDEKEIKNICAKNDTAFLYSSNFSIGVNIFFEINKKLAELMDKYSNYNVSMEETHHIHKLDKPSGTALSLAKDIIKTSKIFSNIPDNKEDIVKKLNIKSIREGEVFGNHKVKWESEIDSICIEHNAKSRDGFALGAIIAAEFIYNKRGIYYMKDIIGM